MGNREFYILNLLEEIWGTIVTKTPAVNNSGVQVENMGINKEYTGMIMQYSFWINEWSAGRNVDQDEASKIAILGCNFTCFHGNSQISPKYHLGHIEVFEVSVTSSRVSFPDQQIRYLFS